MFQVDLEVECDTSIENRNFYPGTVVRAWMVPSGVVGETAYSEDDEK